MIQVEGGGGTRFNIFAQIAAPNELDGVWIQKTGASRVRIELRDPFYIRQTPAQFPNLAATNIKETTPQPLYDKTRNVIYYCTASNSGSTHYVYVYAYNVNTEATTTIHTKSFSTSSSSGRYYNVSLMQDVDNLYYVYSYGYTTSSDVDNGYHGTIVQIHKDTYAETTLRAAVRNSPSGTNTIPVRAILVGRMIYYQDYTKFYSFDLDTSTWTTLLSGLNAGAQKSMLISYNDSKIYSFEPATSSSSAAQRIWCYDIATNTETILTSPYTNTGFDGVSGFQFGRYLYLASMLQNGNLDTYDPVTQSLETVDIFAGTVPIIKYLAMQVDDNSFYLSSDGAQWYLLEFVNELVEGDVWLVLEENPERSILLLDDAKTNMRSGVSAVYGYVNGALPELLPAKYNIGGAGWAAL